MAAEGDGWIAASAWVGFISLLINLFLLWILYGKFSTMTDEADIKPTLKYISYAILLSMRII